jgi:hypothetical protein
VVITDPDNTAVGDLALVNNTGGFNTATGFGALFANTTGEANTANGVAALVLNTTGSNNTATGLFALFSNTTGENNTAIGFDALFFNETGSFHTAIGANALQNCVAPPDFAGNTAIGSEALFSDTTGNFNVAVGDSALKLNTTGAVNTAIGLDALVFNSTGEQNTATGGNALFNNTEGIQNTATGTNAVFSNTTGDLNTGVGQGAVSNNVTGSSNTAIGANALVNSTSGDGNTALGANAGNAVGTASNVICIGNSGADVSGTTWISNVFGVTTQSGTTAPVIVSNTGQLGTLVSSERFKKDIATMQKTSEAILALRPVTFHYKSDTKETPQFGLIAEEVAKVNPALVLPDKEGKPYTVRYDQVNAMLLNEFLKEHRKVEDLEANAARQQKQIEALTAGLQKVSAQLEVSKPAPQVVINP